MKSHVIIPIFISHMGCNNDCVFCNQRVITARSKPIEPESIREIIETHLSSLAPSIKTVELAFYGGSFTGLTFQQQKAYLEIAKKYKDAGKIHKIHMSTRPDYINRPVLALLKSYLVDTIELGVQSFDEKVLALSKRGHDAKSIYMAVQLLKEYDFEFGIQLMVGLPGDTLEKSLFSAREAARLKPTLARIYPTLVLPDTELQLMSKNGSYQPLDEKTAVKWCKEIYKILVEAGIYVMRVGLKSTDLINNENLGITSYHPAFRQLVEGEIAREEVLKQLEDMDLSNVKSIVMISSPKSFSNLVGHKAKNKKYFLEKYEGYNIRFVNSKKVTEGKYIVHVEYSNAK